ncbi:MAG TPA: RidA family protein [Rhodocyclaceae bacterium]|nr:RidA family protein [Rhodocyclaceae bacterium]
MIQRFDTGPRMSEMAVHNGVAYLAGQVAEDPSADIVGQTGQVLRAIDELLKQATTDKTHILRAEIFLTDMADFAGMNEAWDQWVPHGATPARATVQATLARPDWKIEIVITAAVPNPDGGR